ncbi:MULTISPECIES: hypothetical protein [Thermoanaerobacterium]|uniref:Uncharacterized protein n=2 Tax=Thermoanaerobacterium TaxID=28895 RepID=W9EEL3_9THEO|nr:MULTISPECIES: hypothetical protein [Thermoanaerobacterium]AFK85457.1 hypothetical protein Tsac_0427 [Thermoanaerobacterium saccharolyticum JW/SL-YS485]ETO39415.1 hypothetical protein V518_0455 [Thermoanaerobacterium aotearoense SCUT27]MCP2238764.1 hypothetical protein [Thermoanaerobacterium thermosaccharolyticum]
MIKGCGRKKVMLQKIENGIEAENIVITEDEQLIEPYEKDRFENLLKFIKENFVDITKEFTEEEKELLKMHWGIDMSLMTFSEIAEIKHMDESILRSKLKDLEKRFFHSTR